jgi:hypothetical protein
MVRTAGQMVKGQLLYTVMVRAAALQAAPRRPTAIVKDFIVRLGLMSDWEGYKMQ